VLKVLRQRDFGLLWIAGFISLLGDWMLSIALPVAVYELTGSAVATGTLLITRMLPVLVLGSVAGVFVDRWDRKRTMIVANLVRAPLLVALVLVDSADRIWILYVVGFLVSILSQFFRPAEDALLPLLVREDDLVPANALNALNNNLSRLIGPAVGGVVAAWWGLGGVAIVDSATFLIPAGMIAMIRTPVRASREPVGQSETASHALAVFWHEWLDGLRTIRSNHALRLVFTVIAISSIGEGVMGTAFWVYIDEALHGGSKEAGLLMSAQAIGGIVGSFVIGAIGRSFSAYRLLGWGAIGLGVIDMLTFNYPAFISGVWLGVVFMAIVGIPVSAYQAGYMSTVHTESTDAYRGRIFGALNATAAMLAMVGAVIAGLVTGRLGAVPTLTVQSASYVVAVLFALKVMAARAPASVEAEPIASSQAPLS
jgi:MFS family permease